MNESFILIFLSFIADKLSRKSGRITYSGTWLHILLPGTKIADVIFGGKKIWNSLYFFSSSPGQNLCSKNPYSIFFQPQRYLQGWECKNREQTYGQSITEELPCPLARPQRKTFHSSASSCPQSLPLQSRPFAPVPGHRADPAGRARFGLCHFSMSSHLIRTWTLTFLLFKIVFP